MVKSEVAAGAPAPVHFTPVPFSKARSDGWTAARQRAFIAALAQTGSVTKSCAAVGMAFAGVYRLRQRPEAASFAAAWDAAVAAGAEAVRERLVDHALNGVPEDVWHGGRVVGARRRYNTRAMMWVADKADKQRNQAREERESEEGKRRAAEALRKQITLRLDRIAQGIDRDKLAELNGFAADPARRAAYDLLYGAIDWAAIARGELPPALRCYEPR